MTIIIRFYCSDKLEQRNRCRASLVLTTHNSENYPATADRAQRTTVVFSVACYWRKRTPSDRACVCVCVRACRQRVCHPRDKFFFLFPFFDPRTHMAAESWPTYGVSPRHNITCLFCLGDPPPASSLLGEQLSTHNLGGF